MKHKFSITRTFIAFACLLLSSLASSCSEFAPSDGRYCVKKVDEGLESSTYQLVQVKGFGQTWLKAERGKYHVGDTLCMGAYPCR